MASPPEPDFGLTETLWEALGHHGVLDLIKSCHSNVKDDRRASHIELIKTRTALEQYTGLYQNLVRSIGAS